MRNKEFILGILAEYLQNQLNKVNTTDTIFLDDLPTLPITPKPDDPQSFNEVEKAILNLKDSKTAGPDNIPAEVIGMVDVLHTEGCIILSMTADPLSVYHSNEKMPTLFFIQAKG